ncbi:MAG: hypothetical protein QXK39_05870 [Nitrososphaerota archaeon]
MKPYILTLVWLMVGISIFSWMYIQYVYPLDIAAGYLSRAQSAGYAEDVARYVRLALPHIPRGGNPVWMFPTSRTDFTLMNGDLNAILDRLSIAAGLPRDTSAYSQALNDIRGRLGIIINNIGEAMPYIMLSPTNTAILVLWMLSLPIIHRLSRRLIRRESQPVGQERH